VSNDTLDNAYVDLLSELILAAQGFGERSLRDCAAEVWLAMTNERASDEVLDAILSEGA